MHQHTINSVNIRFLLAEADFRDPNSTFFWVPAYFFPYTPRIWIAFKNRSSDSLEISKIDPDWNYKHVQSGNKLWKFAGTLAVRLKTNFRKCTESLRH